MDFFEIIAVDIAITFVVVMLFYVFYQNIVKNRWSYNACMFFFVIFAFSIVFWSYQLIFFCYFIQSYLPQMSVGVEIIQGLKFYCYKVLNITHCFEYNRIIENRCFRGKDYIFSLETIFFGMLDKFWLRRHRLEKQPQNGEGSRNHDISPWTISEKFISAKTNS